jgi:VWFA-related protein
VIVLTDGQDTPYLMESEGDLRKLRRTAREQRVPIYIIGLENDAARYAILPQTRRYLTASRSHMEELAEITGGRLLFPRTLNEVLPLYGQIGRELGTSYSFGYISSQPELDGEFRRIEVKTRDSALRLTQSRSGYTAR